MLKCAINYKKNTTKTTFGFAVGLKEYFSPAGYGDVRFIKLKGTVTRDLIWLKVVSLDRSWLVGLTDDL